MDPPIQLSFDSPTDTHYFGEKFKNYPLDNIACLKTTNGGEKYYDFSFVCDEFCGDENFSPILTPSEVEDIASEVIFEQ